MQRWPRKKKKKVARNFLKFCMEVYNLILRTSGKYLEKIPTNEVFMRWCLGVGKPRAHFGLGVGKPRACFGLGVGKLVPWCGQAARVGALVWASCTRWCLGVGTLVPWCGKPRARFALGVGKPRAHFGLGRATLASEKKKKKVARNFLKFCMEVYNLILSTSGKDLEKIPTNEVFMRWCLGVGKPRAHFGLGVLNLALAVQRWPRKKKKKVARNFLKFCMEVYNLILSTSGKDHEKIPTNEVFMREGDRSSTRCVPSWHTCKCFKTSLGGGGDLCPPHRWDPPSRVALAWACRTRWCLGVGKPHPLVPWRGQAVGKFWPWRGHVGALVWASCTRWCLGMGKANALVPWRGHVGALVWQAVGTFCPWRWHWTC
jgi:hypothetical protein